MKNNIETLVGASLPRTARLINVLIVTTDASFCSCQCWGGSKEAAKFAVRKIAAGLDPSNSWDGVVLHVFMHSIETGTTIRYDADNGDHRMMLNDAL